MGLPNDMARRCAGRIQFGSSSREALLTDVQRLHRRILGAAAMLATLVIGPSAPAQTLKSWRHGVITRESDAGFVMMPMRNGFPGKYGLEIDVAQFGDGTLALKALIANEVDSI